MLDEVRSLQPVRGVIGREFRNRFDESEARRNDRSSFYALDRHNRPQVHAHGQHDLIAIACDSSREVAESGVSYSPSIMHPEPLTPPMSTRIVSRPGSVCLVRDSGINISRCLISFTAQCAGTYRPIDAGVFAGPG
jgi:hypothetical protein